MFEVEKPLFNVEQHGKGDEIFRWMYDPEL
jgi:hypothetical protein